MGYQNWWSHGHPKQLCQTNHGTWYPVVTSIALVVICTMGKEIGRLYKKNLSKLSTYTLKKPVLSSSAAHASSESNLTQTSIQSQLDKKDITTNQIKNNTSNTNDIHSYITPRKQNYSVQAKYTITRLTTLKGTLPIASVELHTTKKMLPAGK